MEFNRRQGLSNDDSGALLSLQNEISPEDSRRLERVRKAWNFYDGYHYEGIPTQDKPEVTKNYCRAFVNKFVSVELSNAFGIDYPNEIQELKVKGDMGVVKYLEDVWKDNDKTIFSLELGQMKSITGDAWVQIQYNAKGEFKDPFNEFPEGRIKVSVVSSSIIFPEYDTHDRNTLNKVTIAYPITVEDERVLGRKHKLRRVLYKQIWTDSRVEVWEGKELKVDAPNEYGLIPFIQIKNFPVAGRSEGLSDLEDIIPLNVEMNLKDSDLSEVIDYHSAPVTVVQGAKVSNLERGANKVWGGLPKDALVKNLELQGDMSAGLNYIASIKNAMHEVGSVPEGSLGGQQHISNTSGVALAYANLPLIERVKVKKGSTIEGLQQVNKVILSISVNKGIITIPKGITSKQFYDNEVVITDNLPKDDLIELQKIDTEMKLGLENREGAMRRMGKREIGNSILEIDKDRRENPQIYGLETEEGKASRLFSNKDGNTKQINSGVTNGSTFVEEVRKEMTGVNKR